MTVVEHAKSVTKRKNEDTSMAHTYSQTHKLYANLFLIIVNCLLLKYSRINQKVRQYQRCQCNTGYTTIRVCSPIQHKRNVDAFHHNHATPRLHLLNLASLHPDQSNSDPDWHNTPDTLVHALDTTAGNESMKNDKSKEYPAD